MRTQRVIISFIVTVLAILSMSGAVLAAEMRRVEFDQASTVSGIVTNMDGEPLAGVYVNADPMTEVDEYLSNAITDANGQYTLTLPIGIYRLHFYDGAGTYDDRWYGGDTWEDAADVSIPGIPVTGIDVVMDMGNTMSGTLSFIDDDDEWSATVVLFQWYENGTNSSWSWVDGQDVYTATTWTFTGLTAGTYRVCAYSGTEGTATMPYRYAETCYGTGSIEDVENAIDVIIGEGEKVTGIDLVFEPYPYTMSGTVRHEDGTPLSGIEIYGRNSSTLTGGSYRAITDADGQYSIRVDSGTYELSFNHPNELYKHITTTVTIADVNVGDVDVAMADNYGIVGMLQLGNTDTVSGFVTAYQWYEYAGSPNDGYWSSVKTVYTSDDGTYFMAVPSGAYRLCAATNGYYQGLPESYAGCYGSVRTPMQSPDVVVVAEENITAHIDFSTHSVGTLTGVVTNEAGDPLAGIEVSVGIDVENTQYILFAPFYHSTTTDENGRYTFTIADIPYRLFFEDPTHTYADERFDNIPSYRYEFTSVDVIVDETIQADAVLETAGQLVGTIHVEGGTVQYSTIRIVSFEDDLEYTIATGEIMTDGTYMIDGLPSGTYKMCYSFGGYFAGNVPPPNTPTDFNHTGCYDGVDDAIDAVDVTIGSGETVTVDVNVDVNPELPPVQDSGIMGTARDTAGNPLPNIQVALYKEYDHAYLDIPEDQPLPPIIIDVLPPTEPGGEPIVITAENGFVGAYELVYTTTDEQGAYAFGSLPDGRYYVGFRDPASVYAGTYYGAADLHNSTPLNIENGNESGNSISNIDGELALSGNIVGVITLDGLTMEEASQFFEDIAIQAIDSYLHPVHFFDSAGTGAGGTYTLGGIPAGEYIVGAYLAAKHESGYTLYRSEYHENVQFVEDATLVTVVPGETITVNFTLEKSILPFITTDHSFAAHDLWTGEMNLLVVTNMPDIEVTATTPACDNATAATLTVANESETAAYEIALDENNEGNVWRTTIAATDWISGNINVLWTCDETVAIQSAGTVEVWADWNGSEPPVPPIEEEATEIVEGEAIPLAVTLGQVDGTAASILPVIMMIVLVMLASSVSVVVREK